MGRLSKAALLGLSLLTIAATAGCAQPYPYSRDQPRAGIYPGFAHPAYPYYAPYPSYGYDYSGVGMGNRGGDQ